MTTATTTKTITLTDLAKAVNNLIEAHPKRINPTDDNGDTCVYHVESTDERCLIGQALYDLTGKNVPGDFEGDGVYTLLQDMVFLSHFGLVREPTDDDTLYALVGVQNVADSYAPWGDAQQIEFDESKLP